jgi:hypothetical protein
MKSKRNTCLLNLILSFALLLTAYSAAHAQAKPDLIITDARMTTQKRGDYVYQFTFTVTIANYCLGTTAGASSVSVTLIPEDPEGGAGHHINRNVASINGGESLTMTIKTYKGDGEATYYNDLFFKWFNKTGKLPRVLFKLDSANKVKEANENNNWWQLNPNKAPPKLSGQFQCSPKI